MNIFSYPGFTNIFLVDIGILTEKHLGIQVYGVAPRSRGIWVEQQTGGFGSHFWTSSLETLGLFKKKDSPDPLPKITDEDRRHKVLEAAETIERFVPLANIAMGLIQMMILNVKSTEEIEALRDTCELIHSDAYRRAL